MNRPLKRFHIGPYSVSLWANAYRGEDGAERLGKSVTLDKVYFDKDGKSARAALSMKPVEIGSVIALLQEMHAAVIEERQINGAEESAQDSHF